jgi:hypothetical protein
MAQIGYKGFRGLHVVNLPSGKAKRPHRTPNHDNLLMDRSRRVIFGWCQRAKVDDCAQCPFDDCKVGSKVKLRSGE